MITSRGQAVRCPVLNIRKRTGSKGVKLVNLDKKDSLIGISEVMELDEEKNVESQDIIEDEETTESIEVAVKNHLWKIKQSDLKIFVSLLSHTVFLSVHNNKTHRTRHCEILIFLDHSKVLLFR